MKSDDNGVPGFLLEWAKLPGPAKLLAEARYRLERGKLGKRAQIDIPLMNTEREEIGRLLPPLWATGNNPVKVADLRAALEDNNTTLHELLVATGGKIRDLRASRQQKREATQADRQRGIEIVEQIVADLSGAHHPGSQGREQIERILRGNPQWEAAASQVRAVVTAARAAGSIRLPVLAAQVFGDAHALDRNQAVGRNCARISALAKVSDVESYTDPLGDAEAWRQAWMNLGVSCDEVSAQVLVLNLPLVGTAAAVALANSVAGEPVWLSLRSLHGSLGLAPGVPDVFVCENPSVVEAAADAYGAACKPLICTFGFPNQATLTLLSAISSQTHLRIRADADEAGWRIVRLLQFEGSSRWRMPADQRGYEEEFLDDLLSDLSD